MKNISRAALLTVLFSASASLFSSENISSDTAQTTLNNKASKHIQIPANCAKFMLTAKIPTLISDYTFKYALDKIINIKYLNKYLKDTRFAQNTGNLGVLLVYITGLYLTYKLYKYATTENPIEEDLFECPDLN